MTLVPPRCSARRRALCLTSTALKIFLIAVMYRSSAAAAAGGEYSARGGSLSPRAWVVGRGEEPGALRRVSVIASGSGGCISHGGSSSDMSGSVGGGGGAA